MVAGKCFCSSGFILVFLTCSFVYAGLLPSNGDINSYARTSLRIWTQELHTELLFLFQPGPGGNEDAILKLKATSALE